MKIKESSSSVIQPETIMKKLSILLRVIGIVQLILGTALLFVPQLFTAWMGLSPAGTDNNYLFAMLSARFLAYGIGMFYIARDPANHPFWINNMILIQVTDLAAGLFYTLNGTLALSVSGFPMFNATLFIILLLLWRPKTDTKKS